MRIFAFIMAFLVLGLSFIPCADAPLSSSDDKSKTEINRQDKQDGDHEDNCSPFCNCDCCAHYPLSYIHSLETGFVAIAVKTYKSYLSNSIIEVSLSIWQPPQLV